jgi:hypothetical protein
MRFLSRMKEEVPTAVDLTPSMIERAAVAGTAQESQDRLTDIYGRVDPPALVALRRRR